MNILYTYDLGFMLVLTLHALDRATL